VIVDGLPYDDAQVIAIDRDARARPAVRKDSSVNPDGRHVLEIDAVSPIAFHGYRDNLSLRCW